MVDSPPKGPPKRRWITSSPVKSPVKVFPQRRPLRVVTRTNQDSPSQSTSTSQKPSRLPKRTSKLKQSTRRHSKALLIAGGLADKSVIQNFAMSRIGIRKEWKNCLMLVENACSEHESCEDFSLASLEAIMNKCNELSYKFWPHIKDRVLFERYLEGEDLLADAVQNKSWEEMKCKFCFFEYLLSCKSMYVWLVVLKYLGMTKEYQRSVDCLHVMNEDVAKLDIWVGQVLKSESGKGA